MDMPMPDQRADTITSTALQATSPHSANRVSSVSKAMKDMSLDTSDTNASSSTRNPPIASHRHFSVPPNMAAHASSSSGSNGGTRGRNSPRTLSPRVAKLQSQLLFKAQTLLQVHVGFDLVPQSGKVVVFDCRIPLKEAFYGLADNEIKGAPVWDSEKRRFTGMLTVTDLIDIILHYHKNALPDLTVSQALDQQVIKDWAGIKHNLGKLLYIYAHENLGYAVDMMSKYRVHRLVVLQEPPNTSVLCIITFQRLMRFLLRKFGDDEPFLELTVEELGVGTFSGLITCTYDDALIDVLQTMSDRKLSGVPIMSQQGPQGVAVDIYSRSDIRYLAQDNAFDISTSTVGQALQKHKHHRPVPICSMKDSLKIVLKRIIASGKHRILVVNERKQLLGVISLTDIMRYLVSSTPAALMASIGGTISDAVPSMGVSALTHPAPTHVSSNMSLDSSGLGGTSGGLGFHSPAGSSPSMPLGLPPRAEHKERGSAGRRKLAGKGPPRLFASDYLLGTDKSASTPLTPQEYGIGGHAQRMLHGQGGVLDTSAELGLPSALPTAIADHLQHNELPHSQSDNQPLQFMLAAQHADDPELHD